VIPIEINESFLPAGYEHYFNLLKLRRLIGKEIWEEVTAANPVATEIDFNAVVQKRYGERGLRVAQDVLKKGSSPTFFADEELVVASFLTGILSGYHTVVLTRDIAIQEQYFKLWQMMVEDYRAHCLAWAAKNHLAQFVRKIPNTTLFTPSTTPYTDFIVEEELETIQLKLEGAEDVALPPVENVRGLVVSCYLFGGTQNSVTVSRFSGWLEREMTPLLMIKKAFDGRNTELFGDRNLSVGCHRDEQGNAACIGVIYRDKYIEKFGMRFRVLDVYRALVNQETSMRMLYGLHDPADKLTPDERMNAMNCSIERSSGVLIPRKRRVVPANVLDLHRLYQRKGKKR
jgi:hypothetical protein